MSATKTFNIDAVSGRGLDALVAEHVMRYGQVADKFSDWITPSGLRYANAELPEFSSINRIWFREVEAVIASLGLNTEYMRKLILEVDPLANPESMLLLHWFNVLRATPDQRCRAALRAVLEASQ